MFMQYVDVLVLSVKKKEMTETEAMLRYKEYNPAGHHRIRDALSAPIALSPCPLMTAT